MDEKTFFNRLSKDLGCLIEQHGPDAIFGTHAILDSNNEFSVKLIPILFLQLGLLITQKSA